MYLFILKHYLFWQIFVIFLKCENVNSVSVGDGIPSVSNVLSKDKIEERKFSDNTYKNKLEISSNEEKGKTKRYLRNQGFSDENSSSLFLIDHIEDDNLSMNDDNVSAIPLNVDGEEKDEKSAEISNVHNLYGNVMDNRVIEETNQGLENHESISDSGSSNTNDDNNNNDNNNDNNSNNNNNDNNNDNNNNNNNDDDDNDKINMMNTINDNNYNNNNDQEFNNECETKYKLVDKLKQWKFLYNFVEKTKVMKTINLCSFESYVFWSVTIRNTNNVLDVLSTIYGFIPNSLFILLVLAYLVSFNKNILFLILMITVECVFIEQFLKNMIKMKRPDSSAVKSYGMPSGHSSVSISCIAFIGSILLEEKQRNIWSYIVMGLLLPIFLPIPWSRMHIQDHSSSQIMLGMMMGVFFGLCCYLLRKKIIKKA